MDDIIVTTSEDVDELSRVLWFFAGLLVGGFVGGIIGTIIAAAIYGV